MLGEVCLSIREHASERDLARAVSIFSDTHFTFNGQTYCVEYVSRDEQNRLLLHGVKEDTMDLMDDIVLEQAFEDVERKPEPRDGLLTVGEVARILRVDDTTVRRWIIEGALPAICLPHRGARKTYRIQQSVLDALFRQKRGRP